MNAGSSVARNSSRPTHRRRRTTCRAPTEPPMSSTIAPAVDVGDRLQRPVVVPRGRGRRAVPSVTPAVRQRQHVVAADRVVEVREPVEERHVGQGAVPSLIDAAAPSGDERRRRRAGTSAPATARSSIVTTSSNTRRPFGNPARSPPRMPLMFGVAARRDRHVEPQLVGEHRPGVVLEPGDEPAGSRSAGSPPGRRGPSSSAARFGNTPGYRTGSSLASSGRSTYWREVLVAIGGRAVPLVLALDRHDAPR